MIETLTRFIGPLLRVYPVAPHIPAGARDVEVFRASESYLNYRYTIAAIPFVLAGLGGFVVCSFAIFATARQNFAWLGILGTVLFLGIYGVFAVLAFASIRLDYEYHHYVITDRSLRIRHGIWEQLEVTLTYANVQNVRVEQGPLERAFNIASVIVETAGGKKLQAEGGNHSIHRGVIRGIENAAGLREKIMRRVGQERSTGLGDHDDHPLLDAPAELDRQLLIEIRDEARKLALC
jgi:membrane protein YdbS with pleckstrin-like domain